MRRQVQPTPAPFRHGLTLSALHRTDFESAASASINCIVFVGAPMVIPDDWPDVPQLVETSNENPSLDESQIDFFSGARGSNPQEVPHDSAPRRNRSKE